MQEDFGANLALHTIMMLLSLTSLNLGFWKVEGTNRYIPDC